ncbi:MAG: cysteine-rich CWC family protein [Marinomonas colpomeniae]
MNCPFCLTDNRCVINEKQSCWCFTMTIPAGMLELVPSQKKDKVCICRSCIELYNKDPKNFLNICRSV